MTGFRITRPLRFPHYEGTDVLGPSLGSNDPVLKWVKDSLTGV